MGPTSNQVEHRSAKNVTLLIIKLDLSAQRRLQVGSMDVSFLAKKPLVMDVSHSIPIGKIDVKRSMSFLIGETYIDLWLCVKVSMSRFITI